MEITELCEFESKCVVLSSIDWTDKRRNFHLFTYTVGGEMPSKLNLISNFAVRWACVVHVFCLALHNVN